jgi:hypothetical protein
MRHYVHHQGLHLKSNPLLRIPAGRVFSLLAIHGVQVGASKTGHILLISADGLKLQFIFHRRWMNKSKPPLGNTSVAWPPTNWGQLRSSRASDQIHAILLTSSAAHGAQYILHTGSTTLARNRG